MMKLLYFFLIISTIFNIALFGQNVKLIETHLPKTSFRGLSIAGNAVWVSGSGGMVGRSVDGGNSWDWKVVKGYEKNDFRDIEAFDDKTAVIIAIASPAYILRTADGGNSWTKVYENRDTSMFLDAMAFKNNTHGMVVGDPINDKIFIAETNDGGKSWQPTNRLQLPNAKPGEAFFAASGTNIVWSGSDYYITSGGMASRIFFNKKAITLPTTQGQQMTGANGLAIQGKSILVPSGNYLNREIKDSVFTYSKDGGRTWKLSETMPSGYKSCVCFIGKNKAITCGITGVDISYDGGKNWKTINKESFNTCVYSSKENAVYFVGNNGRLGKLSL